MVTLGGGVALNNQQVVPQGIQEHLDDFLYVEKPDIQITPLGDEIGLYGALARGAEHTSATTDAQSVTTRDYQP